MECNISGVAAHQEELQRVAATSLRFCFVLFTQHGGWKRWWSAPVLPWEYVLHIQLSSSVLFCDKLAGKHGQSGCSGFDKLLLIHMQLCPKFSSSSARGFSRFMHLFFFFLYWKINGEMGTYVHGCQFTEASYFSKVTLQHLLAENVLCFYCTVSG